MAYESREINREQVVKYLNHAFAKAIQPLGNKNVKGTELYNHQVDFCYLIDSIQRDPTYIVSKVIADCNTLIDNINQPTN